MITQDAQAILFFDHLELLTSSHGLSRSFSPFAKKIDGICASWARWLQLDPCTLQSWNTHDFQTQKPTTLFLDQGYWAIMVHHAKPKSFATWLASLHTAPDLKLKTKKLQGSAFQIHTLEQHGDENTIETILSIAYDGALVLILPGEKLGQLQRNDKTPDPVSWLTARLLQPAKQAWNARPANRKLRQKLSTHTSISLLFHPNVWLSLLPATNLEASEQKTRMLSQLDWFGAWFELQPQKRKILLHVLSQENMEEPRMLSSLGKPKTPMNAFGGLLKPGILGALRVSVDPDKLLALLSSTMTHASRRQFNTFVTSLRKDFALDPHASIINNTQGNALVVFYGLNPEAFPADTPNPNLLRDIFFLRATREVIYLPIEQRKPLALFLDALTQLSKGKLLRKPVKDVVQYAWMEKDTLQWALLLSDKFVLFVDSAPAFSHAMEFIRNPAPLDSSLGLDTFFDQKHQASLYLDASSLKTLLPSNTPKLMLDGLSFVDKVLILTREEGPFGVADIELTLTPQL